MSLSHWASAARREAYWCAYEESLTLWPGPYVSHFVDTQYGSTHVVTCGAQDGQPIVLLHASSLSAVQRNDLSP